MRKLYEPQLYKGSKIIPIFEEYFYPKDKSNLNKILPMTCSIGFEPNPHHEQVLKGEKTIKLSTIVH